MRPAADVPVPERMSDLPRHGGLAVGWVFARDAAGIPDFTVHDDERHAQAITDRLCQLCGQPLDYWMAFVGGPRSTENRMYTEPPMHEECARYALAVCPFLLAQRDFAERDPRPGLDRPDHHPLFSPENPARFGLLICRDFKIVALPGQTGYALKPASAKRIEWWVAGESVPS